MTLTENSRRICLVATLLLVASGCGRERPLAEGMNLLLVTLDTTRVDFVSPFGGDPQITPQLQALADRSCVFTRAMSETNVTAPSHLTIMSGLRMIEHGIMTNQALVPDRVDTLAEAMKRAGYRTAAFPAVEHVGTRMGWRGFDTLDQLDRVATAAEVSDRALKWLEEAVDSPFFVWVHYFDPHMPYQAPPEIAARFYQGDREAGDRPKITAHEFFSRTKRPRRLIRWLGDTRDPAYPRAMYAAEIHYADRELGRLLAGLERFGRTSDTVVVVVADHGESLGEHGIFYGHDGIYEQQLRIPLIVHVPGLAASRSDVPVTTLDLVPSISELTGVRLRGELSGLSLVPLLQGEGSRALAARDRLVHQHAKNYSVALRQDGWKLIWPIFKRDPVLPNQPELYHLREDPEELVDLAATNPERVRSMRRLLRPWIELGRVKRGDTPELDEEALEQLRALGYVDD